MSAWTWPPNNGNVVSFNGRTGTVVPASDDYNSNQITNLSSVAGANVSAALNAVVPFATFDANVQPVLGVVLQNPFIDPPTYPSADDVEVRASADLIADWGFSIYNVTDGVAITTRAGEVNPRVQHAVNNSYRSTYRKGTLFFQGPGPSKDVLIYKALSSPPADGDVFWGRGVTVSNLAGPTANNMGSVLLRIFKLAAGVPDPNNLVQCGTTPAGSGDQKSLFRTIVGGVTTTLDGKSQPQIVPDILGLYFSGGNNDVLSFAQLSDKNAQIWSNATNQAHPGAAFCGSLTHWGFLVNSGVAGLVFGTVQLGFLRRVGTSPAAGVTGWPGVY